MAGAGGPRYCFTGRGGSGYPFPRHVPAEGGLYKTENSGNTWKIINNTNLFFSKRYHFENISFINEQIGVVSAYNGEILYTNNSGKSWSIINSKINTDFHSILMVNENTFFVGGNDGVFLKISL